MPYVTSVERLATEKGVQQGLQKGLQKGLQEGRQQECLALITRQLRRKFGRESSLENTLAHLSQYSLVELEELADALLDFNTIKDLTTWLKH